MDHSVKETMSSEALVEGQQAKQSKDFCIKRSDDILELPEHFQVGQAIHPAQTTIQTKQQSSQSSDFDYKVTPEEELVNIIKSGDSEEEKLATIQRLFKREPNLDINFHCKVNRDTPLHIVVHKKELKIIEWFVKNGAKNYIKNSKDSTQLEVAQDLDRQDIVDILLESHIQPKVQSSTQQKGIRADFEEDESEHCDTKRQRTSLGEVEKPRGTKRMQNEESEAGQVKKRKISKEYRASGLKSSLHGTVYQLRLLMLFLKRGFNQGYSFDMATEMDAAGKFDDIVFQYIEGDKKVYRFLQAKHKQDDNKLITVNDLLTEEDDEFSLQKYFISYRTINQNFKDFKLKDFVICTNIGLEKKLRNSFESVEEEDNILRFNGKNAERLKLKLDKLDLDKKERLVSILKETSERNRLAKRLANCVFKNKLLDLKDDLFESYHNVLVEKIINVKNTKKTKEEGKEKWYAKFHSNFLDGSSRELENFRSNFSKAYQKMSKEQMNENEFWQEMKANELQISDNFRRVFEVDNDPHITDTKAFARAIAKEMSVAKQGVLKINKRLCIIKKNISKLAGHVLIKKGNKEKDTYYFSSAFFDDSIKLPGNLDNFKNKLKSEVESRNIEFYRNKYKVHILNFRTCEEAQLNVKPVLPDDYIADDEIESFFEKLVFAVNQPNVDDLGKIIEDEMGEEKDINMIDNELIASKFQKKMLNWMKEKKGRFLTHEDGKAFFKEAKEKISKLMLIYPTFEYRVKIKDFDIAFRKKPSALSYFLKSEKTQIFNLISLHNTILSSIKVYQTLRDDIKYQKFDSYIFVMLSSLLRLKDFVIKAFKSSTSNNLLVIDCTTAEENVDEVYHQLSKVTRSNTNKKIILITQENDLLAGKFKDNFSEEEYEQREDEDNSLTDLKDKSQKKVLNKRKVVFQGEEVSLDTLINERSKYLIDGEVLSKLINNEKIKIGKALTDLKYDDVKDYYIDRTFNRRVKISQELKDEISREFLVTYSEVNKKDSKKNKDILLISDRGESFKELCDKYKKHNIHWFKEERNKWVWTESFGSLSKLRTFLNNQSVEEYKPEKITDITDKVVIIAAEPGMGKSIVLNRLAIKTKESDSLFVIKINLLDYSTELEREKKKRRKITEEEAIKFLYRTVGFQIYKKENEKLIEKVLNAVTVKDSKIVLELNGQRIQGLNLLEIELFNIFYNEGRIALLFDGFDEISPDYKEKVAELLQVLLKKTEIKKMWVTTRPYGIINQLEEKLNTFSYTLKPLTPEDQTDFLKKFWKKKLKLSHLDDDRFTIFTDELFKQLSQRIDDQESRQFLTIPLHLWMIAHTFQDPFKELCDCDKLSNKYKRKIEELTDLTTLYENFIDIKFNKIRFKEKNPGMNIAIPDTKRMVGNVQQDCIVNHGKSAVFAIFKEDEVRKYFVREIRDVKQFMKEVEQGKENTGIIEQIINKKPRFIHRTFAEFFAVKLVTDKLKLKYVQNMWDFLINIIFIEEYHGIRRFFESKLANDHELAALSSKNSNNILKWLKDKIKDGKNPLCAAAKEGLVRIVKFLLDIVEGDADSVFKIISTPGKENLPLCLAIENNQKEIIEILLKYVKGANTDRLIEIINPDTRDSNHALLLALKGGHDEIVNMLLEDIPSNDQITQIIRSAFNNGNGGIVGYASRREISLSVLKKYITRLNANQQVSIFSNFKDLEFEDFKFFFELISFLKPRAFEQVFVQNEQDIVSALGQIQENMNFHPDWYGIKAMTDHFDRVELSIVSSKNDNHCQV